MDQSKPPPSPPPHATAAGPSAGNATANRHAQENFRSLLMKCAIASTPTKSLTPPQKAFIEKRIQEFFPTVHTPDHPPYAWMIENAIKQLNEEGGSNEESISKFILEEHKDLPWAHAAFLKHHLRKLSESGNLVESHDGCYLIGKAIFALNCTSKPTPSLSHTPSPTRSLSPSLSYSSSPTYASSSTSSSSQSFNFKRKGRKRKTRRNYMRKKSQRRKQNERGIIIHPKYAGQGRGRGRGRGRGQGRGRGRGRVRGRGRGRGRGCGRGRNWSYGQPCKDNMMEEVYADQVEDEACLNRMEAVEMQYVMVEDEAADISTQGKEKPQAQVNQDTFDVESEAKQSTMVTQIESPEQEYRGNEDRIEPLQLEKVAGKGTIHSSQGDTLISDQGNTRFCPQKRSTHLKHTPQTERARGRSRKRCMQMGENGKNMEPLEATEIGALRKKNKRKIMEQSQLTEKQCYLPSIDVCLIDDDNVANTRHREIELVSQVEQEEEDSMDELIEEVYMELKDATEIEHATIDDEAAAGNLQRKEHDQAQRDLDSANVECQAEPSTRTIEVDVGPQQQHIVSEERFIMHEKQGDDEGMQHKINQQSADDKKYETSDVQREEQENKYSDDLEEQQQLESKSAGLDGATLVLERKHLKDNQGSWTEGQNHAQIPVQENIGATAEQMLLTEDKDEYSGDPTLKAVAEKKFQPQPLEIELNLVPGESQKQESDGIEQQDQLKGGEMKIIGKKKIREGDCPLIEKESQIKEAFEILEEQNQQIEQPEVIIETNQPDKQHCILVELQEFEHCDELTKVEQQKNEEKCPSGETKVDEHPHEQHNEDQQEKAVEKAEGTQPIEKSKRMGTETLKVGDNAENSQNIILTFEGTSGSKTQNKQKNMEHKNKCGDAKYISERQSDVTSLEMSTEVKPVEDPSTTHSKLQPKQTMVKPQCRQLRPRPPKCQPDQTKEQFDLPNLEKSHEANQRRKLRPRPSKNESTEVENRAESFTARAESRKRLEIGGRRSLRPRSN